MTEKINESINYLIEWLTETYAANNRLICFIIPRNRPQFIILYW